jgi:predicted  nucleic acid-binding Zn-ribbon protein
MELSEVSREQNEAGWFDDYKSPWRALAWRFRKSRDNWKSKYQTVKDQTRRMKRQIRDLTGSKEKWQERAKALEVENRAFQVQLAEFQDALQSAEKKIAR